MFAIIFAQGPLAPAAAPTELFRFTEVFLRLVSILIPIGGLVLFIMLVMGGFSFVTSSGDPRKVEGAKATLTYAILGIVLLASSFLIVQIIANYIGVPAILDFSVYI